MNNASQTDKHQLYKDEKLQIYQAVFWSKVNILCLTKLITNLTHNLQINSISMFDL